MKWLSNFHFLNRHIEVHFLLLHPNYFLSHCGHKKLSKYWLSNLTSSLAIWLAAMINYIYWGVTVIPFQFNWVACILFFFGVLSFRVFCSYLLCYPLPYWTLIINNDGFSMSANLCCRPDKNKSCCALAEYTVLFVFCIQRCQLDLGLSLLWIVCYPSVFFTVFFLINLIVDLFSV